MVHGHQEFHGQQTIPSEANNSKYTSPIKVEPNILLTEEPPYFTKGSFNPNSRNIGIGNPTIIQICYLISNINHQVPIMTKIKPIQLGTMGNQFVAKYEILFYI